MKAIQQIIEYFRSRGILDEHELARLTSAGFLQVTEIADIETAKPRKKSVPVRRERTDEARRDELIDAAEATALAPRPSRANRGGRNVVHKGKILDGEQLRGLLAARLDGWDDRLDGLTGLASYLGCSGDWKKAALTIRGASDPALTAAVIEALEQREPALKDLWAALELEDYRHVSEGARGPVVSAYNKLLSSPEALPASRYRWVLAIDEVAVVGHLREAQRRVLRTFGTVLTERPELMARSVSRDYCPAAYWALVTVYTARRGEPGKRPPPTANEHFPTRPHLDEGERLRAWALAATIEPRAVPPFLVEYNPVVTEYNAIAAKYRAVDWVAFDHAIHREWDYYFKSNGRYGMTLEESFQKAVVEKLKPAVENYFRQDAPRFFADFASPPADVVDAWIDAGKNSLTGIKWERMHVWAPTLPRGMFDPARKAEHCNDLKGALLDKLSRALENFDLMCCPKSWDWNKG